MRWVTFTVSPAERLGQTKQGGALLQQGPPRTTAPSTGPRGTCSNGSLQGLCVRRAAGCHCTSLRRFPLHSQLTQQQSAQRHHPNYPGHPDWIARTVRAPHSLLCRTVLRHPACVFSALISNRLNGTIPSIMDSMTGLTSLCVHRAVGCSCTGLRRSARALSSLNYNRLYGTIPSSMGSLTGVVSLCVRRVARLAPQFAASRVY